MSWDGMADLFFLIVDYSVKHVHTVNGLGLLGAASKHSPYAPRGENWGEAPRTADATSVMRSMAPVALGAGTSWDGMADTFLSGVDYSLKQLHMEQPPVKVPLVSASKQLHTQPVQGGQPPVSALPRTEDAVRVRRSTAPVASGVGMSWDGMRNLRGLGMD